MSKGSRLSSVAVHVCATGLASDSPTTNRDSTSEPGPYGGA